MDSALPAPLAHAALAVLALAPLLVQVPVNANIVLTAAITVLVGCWRSVKPEPPAEAMTKKVRGSLQMFFRNSRQHRLRRRLRGLPPPPAAAAAAAVATGQFRLVAASRQACKPHGSSLLSHRHPCMPPIRSLTFPPPAGITLPTASLALPPPSPSIPPPFPLPACRMPCASPWWAASCSFPSSWRSSSCQRRSSTPSCQARCCAGGPRFVTAVWLAKFPHVCGPLLLGLRPLVVIARMYCSACNAAYFVFLGMLAVVACIDPQLRPLVPKSLGEREIKISIPAIPVVLKVRWGGSGLLVVVPVLAA